HLRDGTGHRSAYRTDSSCGETVARTLMKSIQSRIATALAMAQPAVDSVPAGLAVLALEALKTAELSLPGAPLVLAGYLASTNAVAPWPGWPKNSFDIASGCFRRRAAHRRFGFSPLRCTPATAKPAVRCNCWDTSTQPVGRPPALHRFFPSTPGSQPSPFAPCSKAHVEGIWR